MDELERVRRDGFVVAEDLLTTAEVAEALRELEPHFGVEGWGRNDFEGHRTERMLGYDVVDGLFFGHVDGRNPIKLIERAGDTGPRTRARLEPALADRLAAGCSHVDEDG